MLLEAADWQEEILRPRCIGALDGTHIAVKRPYFNEPGYINRKGYHSINAMVSSLNTLYIYCDRVLLK